MQIPTNFSAAQAASIASVVSSRDKASAVQNTNAPDAQTLIAQLEKSEASSPDRDAQGQGDGFGEHARKSQDENETVADGVAAEQTTTPEEDLPPDLLNCVC